jgi:hypothetical protein
MAEIFKTMPSIIKDIFYDYTPECVPVGTTLEEQLRAIVHATRGNKLIDTRHIEMDKLHKLQLPSSGNIPVVVISTTTNKFQQKCIPTHTFIAAGLKPDAVFRGIVELLARMIRAEQQPS